MKFYAYEQSGVLQSVQWTEDELFHHITQSGNTAVIFARNPEDVDFLSGMKLMYGIDVEITSYIKWINDRSDQAIPQWRFSLEPIPHY